MARAGMYEDNFDKAVIITRSILRLIGIWPLPVSASIVARIAHRIHNIFVYFLLVLAVVPPILYTVLKEKNITMRLKSVGPILNSFMHLIKYSLLLYRAEDIRRSMSTLNEDWLQSSEENREIFRSKAQIARKLVLVFITFTYGSGLSYRTAFPIVKGKIVTPENVTIRPLACPSYFIVFNEQVTPFYEILFTLQWLSGFVSYSTTICICGISATLALHVCSQLRILVNKLEDLVVGDFDEQSVQQRLAAIVEHQTKAKKFLNCVQSTTEYVSFFEVVSCSLLTCLVGFQLIKEWRTSNAIVIVTYVTFLFSFTFCVFILCYIGQLVNNESHNVQQASFTLKWYRLPVKKARCLVLVIAMSNQPMKLMAGKVLDMSLSTFTDVMKMSMGYLNILRSIE